MQKEQRSRVVVIGGGTGTSTVVTTLKKLPVSITALISVADSGGSTGRLRDEFGFQPVGDLRQSLAALAQDKNQEWIRKILLYRFEKGDGLKGHNLGNLLLTALQEMTGSTVSALEVCENIFQLHGTILPVTTENVQLVTEYKDGTKLIGEHKLDDNTVGNQKIKKVSLSPNAHIYERAKEEIHHADLIIIGPGDYYSSIMPALIVDGMKEALQKSDAKLVFIVNIMTRFTQTHGMSAKDHVEGIEHVIGRSFDQIIINTGIIPDDIKVYYEHEKEFEVIHDMKDDSRVVAEDVVMLKAFHQKSSDTAHRSIIRHDPDKLSRILKGLI